MDSKHIILMGFKHVGKTTVGKILAKKLQRPFLDSDIEILKNFQQQDHPLLSCREIFQQYGEQFFRDYETRILRQILHGPPAVIALGGGTPLYEENQLLIKKHVLIYLTGNPTEIYQRIIARGKPAFFPENQDPWQFFQHLWAKREAVYVKLAEITINNAQAASKTVKQLMEKLEESGELHPY